MFLHACVHGAEHYWSRLKWLAQIAAMLRTMTVGVPRNRSPRLAIRRWHRAIGRGGAGEALSTRRCFRVRCCWETSAAVDRIVNRSIETIDEGATHSTNALVDFRDAWRAASSFNYRRNLIERTIIREESWNIVDLPDLVFFGYALLAPIAWFQHRNRKHNPPPTRTQGLVTSATPSDCEAANSGSNVR